MNKWTNWILYSSSLLFYLLLLANMYFGWTFATLESPEKLLLSVSAAVLLSATLLGFYLTDSSIWIYLMVLFIPLEFTHPFLSLPSLTPIDYFGFVAVIALLLKGHWRKLYLDTLNVFGIWTLIAWCLFFLYVLFASLILHGHIRGAFRWVLFLFAYRMTAEIVTKLHEFTFVINISRLLAVLGSSMGILIIAQYFSSTYGYVEATGTFRQHNAAGAFLSLCIPMSLYWTLKARKGSLFFRSTVFVLSVLGFLISYSRGAWAGVAIGSTIILGRLILKRRMNMPAMVTVILTVLIGLFVIPHIRGGLNGRNWYWVVGLNILKTHPWFGLGPGNYSSQIKSYLTGIPLNIYVLDLAYNHGIHFWIHLHDLYLQYLVEYGLVGGGLFFWALGRLIFKAFPPFLTFVGAACQISVIAFLVHNLVDIVSVNSFDILFGILIALASSPSILPDNPLL